MLPERERMPSSMPRPRRNRSKAQEHDEIDSAAEEEVVDASRRSSDRDAGGIEPRRRKPITSWRRITPDESRGIGRPLSAFSEMTRCWCEAVHTAAGGLPPGGAGPDAAAPHVRGPGGPNGSGSRRTRPRSQPQSTGPVSFPVRPRRIRSCYVAARRSWYSETPRRRVRDGWRCPSPICIWLESSTPR